MSLRVAVAVFWNLISVLFLFPVEHISEVSQTRTVGRWAQHSWTQGKLSQERMIIFFIFIFLNICTSASMSTRFSAWLVGKTLADGCQTGFKRWPECCLGITHTRTRTRAHLPRTLLPLVDKVGMTLFWGNHVCKKAGKGLVPVVLIGTAVLLYSYNILSLYFVKRFFNELFYFIKWLRKIKSSGSGYTNFYFIFFAV